MSTNEIMIDETSAYPTVRCPSQAQYDVPLISDERLDSIGIRYHPVYKIFLCVSCKSGTRPDQLVAHAKDKHGKSCSGAALATILRDHPPHAGAHPSLPVFADGQPAIAIPILPAKDGFTCHHCSFATLTEPTMKNHITTHKLRSRTGQFSPSLVQTIYNYGSRRSFPVQLVAPTDEGVSPYAGFLADRNQEERRVLPSLITAADNRDVAPFIRRAGWTEHVRGFNPVQLCALISLPGQQDGPLRTCREFVSRYMSEIQTRIEAMPNLLLLRLLNSETANE